jgi:histidyl-tRNA synthetase
LEPAQLFAPLGAESDIVSKQMFRLAEPADAVLRPEGTAGLARALLEEGLVKAGGGGGGAPCKFFYCGPMFRHERPQRGRFRQFQQFGVESVGVAHPHMDAEVILAAVLSLEALGLRADSHYRIVLNSIGDVETRAAYARALKAFLEARASELSALSRERLAKGAVLRILDSKERADVEGPLRDPKLPLITDVLSDSSKARLAALRGALQLLGVRFEEDPRLVRGLDYYCESVFELVDARRDGGQSALVAGGRYDGLFGALGGPTSVPAVGFAAGIDRIALTLQDVGAGTVVAPPRLHTAAPREFDGEAVPRVAVVCVDPNAEDLRLAAFTLAAQLRTAGFGVLHAHDAALRKGLRLASECGCQVALLVGQDEARAGAVGVRDLRSREQRIVPREAVTARVAELLAAHVESVPPPAPESVP